MNKPRHTSFDHLRAIHDDFGYRVPIADREEDVETLDIRGVADILKTDKLWVQLFQGAGINALYIHAWTLGLKRGFKTKADYKLSITTPGERLIELAAWHLYAVTAEEAAPALEIYKGQYEKPAIWAHFRTLYLNEPLSTTGELPADLT